VRDLLKAHIGKTPHRQWGSNPQFIDCGSKLFTNWAILDKPLRWVYGATTTIPLIKNRLASDVINKCKLHMSRYNCITGASDSDLAYISIYGVVYLSHQVMTLGCRTALMIYTINEAVSFWCFRNPIKLSVVWLQTPDSVYPVGIPSSVRGARKLARWVFNPAWHVSACLFACTHVPHSEGNSMGGPPLFNVVIRNQAIWNQSLERQNFAQGLQYLKAKSDEYD